MKDGSNGQLQARLLSGAWRRQPPTDLNISEAQLEAITPLLLSSGTAALAWNRVRATPLRHSAAALQLQGAYLFQALEVARHERAIQAIFEKLEAAGLQPVLIKGWVNAQSYPETGFRPYSDIDLCIHPEQFQEATTLLGGRIRPNNIVSLAVAEDCLVDLHRGFAVLSDRCDVTVDELLARTQRITLGNTAIRALSAEDHLHLLCIHFLRHGAYRPLWLCDIAAALESRPASFDWQRCLGEDGRRADWVACVLGLAHQLLGAEIADTPVAARARRLPRWLVPALLRAWEHPSPRDNNPRMFRLQSLHPAQLYQFLRKWWPNPITATMGFNGSFNNAPRWPLQCVMCGILLDKYLIRSARQKTKPLVTWPPSADVNFSGQQEQQSP